MCVYLKSRLKWETDKSTYLSVYLSVPYYHYNYSASFVVYYTCIRILNEKRQSGRKLGKAFLNFISLACLLLAS